MRKLPPDAFDYYYSLGPGRSYQAVAEHCGVAKRTVTSLAKRENWRGRLAEIAAKVRERSDQRKVEMEAQEKERRLKALRLLLGKSIQKLHTEINSTVAIATANRLQVVTSNLTEFTRVPGLVVEDWSA